LSVDTLSSPTVKTQKMPSLSKSASSPQPLLHHDNSDAERRLREAEERLREAIEDLHRRNAVHGPYPPCDHGPDESCAAHAIGNLCQSFLLSYGVRVGIGILLRAFKLAKGHSYSSILDLKVYGLSVSWQFHNFVGDVKLGFFV